MQYASYKILIIFTETIHSIEKGSQVVAMGNKWTKVLLFYEEKC